ncbi:hypothetical protein [Dysgonomonas reticulitermitis]
MLSTGIRKYMSNPVIGLLPFILFIFLHTLGVETVYSLSLSILLAIIGEISIRSYYKGRSLSITFYISGISLLTTLFVWFFTFKYLDKGEVFVILCEVFVVIMFMLLRASKTYIAAVFFRQKNLRQKALMNEYYNSASIIQYGLTFHIFGIVLYRQFFHKEDAVGGFDVVLFSILPVLIILSVGIYQVYKISSLSAKLKKEEWIPIVTEKGEVTGKIAKSVSLNMRNRFLHPVVRVVLTSKTKVYLQERDVKDVLSPGKLDYPFEKYMLFNHEINLAARNSISKMVGDDLDISIKFVLKYVFENDNTKRLNFLFVAEIDDEDKIKKNNLMTGKFWTIKQIEESFADEIFSECFELEFEYLKNMVLMPSSSHFIGKAAN